MCPERPTKSFQSFSDVMTGSCKDKKVLTREVGTKGPVNQTAKPRQTVFTYVSSGWSNLKVFHAFSVEPRKINRTKSGRG
jgi:hypothetical protein